MLAAFESVDLLSEDDCPDDFIGDTCRNPSFIWDGLSAIERGCRSDGSRISLASSEAIQAAILALIEELLGRR